MKFVFTKPDGSRLRVRLPDAERAEEIRQSIQRRVEQDAAAAGTPVPDQQVTVKRGKR